MSGILSGSPGGEGSTLKPSPFLDANTLRMDRVHNKREGQERLGKTYSYRPGKASVFINTALLRGFLMHKNCPATIFSGPLNLVEKSRTMMHIPLGQAQCLSP